MVGGMNAEVQPGPATKVAIGAREAAEGAPRIYGAATRVLQERQAQYSHPNILHSLGWD